MQELSELYELVVREILVEIDLRLNHPIECVFNLPRQEVIMLAETILESSEVTKRELN